MTTFKKAYDEALQKIVEGEHSYGEFDIGEVVVCDFCNEDYTDSDEPGGFLFGSYGTCPKCVPRIEIAAKHHNEEDLIRERALPGETFKAFSLRMRQGDNKIRFVPV